MITLSISPHLDSEVTRSLEERLKDLSLDYQLKKEDLLSEPRLTDGDLEFTGFDEIMEHLDRLSGELHLWHYCHC